ncbi:hypothetical protein B0T17DRAFT_19536 [Bombardia bombarda]|uniref:Secreted protein n=1 Tax=Bombardia bombarda TaxID=252184 RepID=A0AA40CEV1_9PEZI|nr:hypothetical protein B0T17DRAFT_19536 [Bombardia bombarda]
MRHKVEPLLLLVSFGPSGTILAPAEWGGICWVNMGRKHVEMKRCLLCIQFALRDKETEEKKKKKKKKKMMATPPPPPPLLSPFRRPGSAKREHKDKTSTSQAKHMQAQACNLTPRGRCSVDSSSFSVLAACDWVMGWGLCQETKRLGVTGSGRLVARTRDEECRRVRVVGYCRG